MVRNIILYIFIYVLCISCGDILTNTDSCDNCILELSIPELEEDNNGYYNLYFDYDYVQNLTKIKVDVGHGREKIGWTSDTEFCVEIWNHTDCHNVVNGSSYSNLDGLAYTMLGVNDIHIGDTITVYCGYYDGWGEQYLDSLGVIIYE